MDFGSCSSHLLPNFTYFRNLLTPAAVRDTLCSDYAALFLELALHHSSRSCRECSECRQKHDPDPNQATCSPGASEHLQLCCCSIQARSSQSARDQLENATRSLYILLKDQCQQCTKQSQRSPLKQHTAISKVTVILLFVGVPCLFCGTG